MKTIADLKIGERGIIVNFTDEGLSVKLLEMRSEERRVGKEC